LEPRREFHGKILQSLLLVQWVSAILTAIVDRKPGTRHLAIAATIWTWRVRSLCGRWESILANPNCRSFVAARLKATIKKRRFLKPNDEWMQSFRFEGLRSRFR
jgi:hypothetical protein